MRYLTTILFSVLEWTRPSPRPEACGEFLFLLGLCRINMNENRDSLLSKDKNKDRTFLFCFEHVLNMKINITQAQTGHTVAV